MAEAALAGEEFTIAGFFDDASPRLERAWDVPVLGKVDDSSRWLETAECAFVAIGNNVVRQRLVRDIWKAGFELATMIHRGAIVSPSVVIGPGSAVMAGACIGIRAQLGKA